MYVCTHASLLFINSLYCAHNSGASSKIGKKDLKKYGAMVREKIESYKKMREELAAMRSGLLATPLLSYTNSSVVHKYVYRI